MYKVEITTSVRNASLTPTGKYQRFLDGFGKLETKSASQRQTAVAQLGGSSSVSTDSKFNVDGRSRPTPSMLIDVLRLTGNEMSSIFDRGCD